MKRRHGLGRLRVRGGERVRLAVYLKALACNVKRMVGARLIEMDETLARPGCPGHCSLRCMSLRVPLPTR